MIDKHRIKHIFFDLDHTLWDFEKNSAATFQFIFKELKVDFSLETFLEFYNPINHYYWKQYRENKITEIELRFLRLEKTFNKMNVSFTHELIDQFSELYIQELSKNTILFKDTVTVLEYLNLKYTLHIITNGFENVQQKKLKNSGIDHFFEVVLTAEKIGIKKPKPEIFLSALKSANAQPEHSLMIGDSLEADILGAKAAGYEVMHFNAHMEPSHDHCLIIHSLDEIKKYL